MSVQDSSATAGQGRSGAVATRRLPISRGLHATADVGGAPDRQTVILMHGGGQTRHSWGGAMRELVGAGYHVINLDARGHGDSDWDPDGDYTLQAFSADLLAIIASMPRPPALVGASLGAATALYTVGQANAPNVTALVLVDLVPRVEAEGAQRIQAFMRARPEGFVTVEEAADAVATYYPHRPRPKDPSGLMKNLRRRADGRLHWHWDPKFTAGPARVEPPEFASTLLSAAARVRVPTLLVRGLRSDIVSDAGVAELRQWMPQLEVCDVAGAGHMVAGDRNDNFNRGVIEFLQRHVAAR